MDIEYTTLVSSPLASPLNHVGMIQGNMTLYPPTQDESPFTVTLPKQVFNFDEEIMEAMTTLAYPWDDCHHQSYFRTQSINPLLTFSNQCTTKMKYFIPPRNINWFRNPIPSLDTFEEGNMSNISPTMTINISTTPGVIENIIIDASCSCNEVNRYTKIFKKNRYVFTWSYIENIGMDPSIIEHHITWPNAPLVHQK